MEKVKGEHFVPQCYLNLFTNNEKLNIYDKKKKEIRKNQSISKIAKQKAFYDFSQDELQALKDTYPEINDEQYIEHYFSANIEPALKSCLDSLRPEKIPQDENLIVQLDEDFKLHLSVQMAYQFLRTQGLRECLPSLLKTDKAFLQKLMIIDDSIIAQWAKFFYDYNWTIGINKTSIPLYTSDNPVCIYNIVTDEIGLNALKHGSCIIYYPYSASVCVTLFDLHKYNIPKSLVMPLDIDYFINFQNAITYKNAFNYVFSQSELIGIDKLINFSDSFKATTGSTKDNDVLNKISIELFTALKNGKINPDKQENILNELLTMTDKYYNMHTNQ